ncbi:outer membrane lipoprotein carrier protein LolA [Geobacter hydrogenophilus]|uniref:Outer-membrane lipoprotein carrier protein n=1 Tax=Geobacter hydrogenophilus TaxID=40983 RepID=A0A9W6FZ12_9BACT|nr:outer membrane lipoprotein carrier protein LolA [Geobacter hydrogenophilus]MBT0893603.1 outer membrane lipoprotein carrier protein LolA [Geobacter hydrogenophilus]GLI37700.1 outer-membrane lipoprotein carrier protein [Geobacter hydrogenophilus]
MKIYRLVIVVFLALLVGAVPATAAPVARVNAGLQDVIDTVEKSFRPDRNTGLPPLATVTADFFQRSTIAGKEREMRADGQMFFKTASSREPLMFRFDYFRPLKQEIVSDGRTLWMYLPENRQVIVSDVTPVFNPYTFNPDRDRASNFLQGLPRISKDFLIVFSPQGQDIAGNYVLELTPRRATAAIAKLFIVVPREAVLSYVQSGRTSVNTVSSIGRQEWPFPILSTTMVDHQGSTTLMEFSNVRTNIMLSDSLFSFAVPPGVQVVKPPRKH